MQPNIRYLFLLLLGSAPFLLLGQSSLTLQESVQAALDKNLQIKLAASTIRNSELSLRQNTLSRLPSLNASIGAGFQFGRTVNPVSNDFISNTITYNTYRINGSVPIFNGGQIARSVRQSRLDVEASRLEAEVTANDIALSVANAYLSILLAEEQLANARQRLGLSEEQLTQTNRLIDAGSLPANDRLDIVSTIALNERTVIEAENLVRLNYLTLKDLLLMTPQEPLQLNAPQASVPAEALTQEFDFLEVYATALQTQPTVRAAQLRQEVAELQDDIARSDFYPSLSLFGSMSTNYSHVSGLPIPNDGFADQLNQNFGQSVGVSLNVPIYNNHRTRIGVERAQIQSINADIQRQQAEQRLRTDVQRAIAEFRTARESYRAAERSVEAAAAAFANAQRRFDLGGINSFEFITSQNNLDQARIEMTRAKYQLLFNYNVVQFYLGNPLELN